MFLYVVTKHRNFHLVVTSSILSSQNCLSTPPRGFASAKQRSGLHKTRKPPAVAVFLSFVDTQVKTLNQLKTFLSQFWGYYQSSQQLQKALEAA
jgi:hypothetical protein